MVDRKKKVSTNVVRKGRKKPTVEKGYKFSNTTRKAMSKAHTGKKLSEETKEKIRQAKAERKLLIEQGFLQPYRHTEETKKHLSRVMKRKKHRPSKIALARSRKERRNRKLDKQAIRTLKKA